MSTKTPRSTPMKSTFQNTATECVRVYCRIRPLVQTSKLSCVTVVDDTTVELSLPMHDVLKSKKKFTFKKIFTENSTQEEVFDEVALPLVEQLVNGGNGLLFTYGVTDSGKTYTMTGHRKDIGIMPRCLDVVFNSISGFPAGKYIFKPDGKNGFDVQTEQKAIRDRLAYENILKKSNSKEDLFSNRNKVDTTVGLKEEQQENAYAVFVTYVEVYNDFVYDLLENAFVNNGLKLEPTAKKIRDSDTGKPYVHGATEIEVETTEEALEVFNIGSRVKKMACTALNDDSSRSHSIFTIRIVQAPLDDEGRTICRDKNSIIVSQLSLVDLAGSERANRTQNTGQRLNEAGKINQSLMGLRKCLETLRSKQSGQRNIDKIPYRDYKITHLFKSFFDGDGDVKMIICINPRMEDAVENAAVMEFAEISQEVRVPRTPQTIRSNLKKIGWTSGRRIGTARKRLLMVPEIEEDCLPMIEFRPSPRREEYSDENDYIEAKMKWLEEVLTPKYEIVRLNCIRMDEDFRGALINTLEFLKNNVDVECSAWKDKYSQMEEKNKKLEDENVSLKSRLEKLLENQNQKNMAYSTSMHPFQRNQFHQTLGYDNASSHSTMVTSSDSFQTSHKRKRNELSSQLPDETGNENQLKRTKTTETKVLKPKPMIR